MPKQNTIFSQLKHEHEDLKKLLKQASECPPNQRKQMLSEIEAELVPHARGEEKTFYSVVRQRALDNKDEELIELSSEAYEEHRVADELMAELKKIEVGSERWPGLFTVIKENLEHHIQEEEEELFKHANKLLSENEKEMILEAYLSSKEHFQESLPSQGQISERTPSQDAQSL